MIKELSSQYQYNISTLCEIMHVNRSGYYKWLNKPQCQKDKEREKILAEVRRIHDAHPTHGAAWVNRKLFNETSIKVSDNYIYKCFRFLGIKTKSKHKPFSKKKVERKHVYVNLVNREWKNIKRPLEVVVSDMTAFYVDGRYWELTLYIDVFTKLIVGYALSQRRGWNQQYYDGLKQVIDLIKNSEGISELTTLHTDQGSVYTSKSYNELVIENGLRRSMSRPGKPTDNPMDESLNGWIKEELFIDFKLGASKNVPKSVEDYIYYYNNERPAYSLGYEIPRDIFNKFTGSEGEFVVSTLKNNIEEKFFDLSTLGNWF